MKNIAKKQGHAANADLAALLNQSLADLLALKLNAKQAHWNVKGENFLTLHELFDRVAIESETHYDTIAERIVQLGGVAEGGIAHIAKRATNASYPQTQDAGKHVKAISSQLEATANQMREAIETADTLGDKVTADIYTQVAAGLDKLHWFVDSHQK